MFIDGGRGEGVMIVKKYAGMYDRRSYLARKQLNNVGQKLVRVLIMLPV